MNINVQAKPHTKSINRFNRPNSSYKNMTPINESNVRAQNNTLVDMNYGSQLVKNNKISFTGVGEVAPKAVLTLAEKINKILPLLGVGDILLVGKEAKAALEAFKKSMGSFEGDIKNVLFADSPNSEEIFAFHKKGPGLQELVNLEGEKMMVEMPGAKPCTIAKGEYLPVISGDKIILKNETIELSLPESEKFQMPVKKPRNKMGYENYAAGHPKEESAPTGQKPARKMGYENYEAGQPKKEDAKTTEGKPKHKTGFDSDIYKKDNKAKPEIVPTTQGFNVFNK